jgi:hypothetical protein
MMLEPMGLAAGPVVPTREWRELYAALEESSQRLGRTVNPTIYTRAELANRIKRGDSFITRVFSQPKIWLVGDDRALGL